MLIWLPDGTKPTPEDFDEQRQDLNPTVFPSFGGAVEHAIAAFEQGESSGRLPWIKIGSEIFDFDHSRAQGAPSMRSKAEALTRHGIRLPNE